MMFEVRHVGEKHMVYLFGVIQGFITHYPPHKIHLMVEGEKPKNWVILAKESESVEAAAEFLIPRTAKVRELYKLR